MNTNLNSTEESTKKLGDLLKLSMESKVEDVVPNFRKKNQMTDEQVENVIQTISLTLKISPERVLIGIMLLFLQGAASAGAPVTMSIDMGEGKCIEKRNITTACEMVAGHQYIRRIAETLARQIGEFAEKNKLAGELAYRINNRYKAETGNNLTDKEMAYCSSFSQSIPDLADITSEKLVKLLAEDYQRRFENKKKVSKPDINKQVQKSGKKTTKPKRRK